MKVVVDTNVFVSGYFFGGIPSKIFKGWMDGLYDLVISTEILNEYQTAGQRFTTGKADYKFYRWLNLISQKANLVISANLAGQVCKDPDDDKFLACALGGGAEIIVSGDKALLDCSGYQGIKVVSPREFVETYLDV